MLWDLEKATWGKCEAEPRNHAQGACWGACEYAPQVSLEPEAAFAEDGQQEPWGLLGLFPAAITNKQTSKQQPET